MSGSNGTSRWVEAVTVLRELSLSPDQEAAVERLETQSMYYSDKELIEAIADEQLPAAGRRRVDRALRASHYRPHRDPSPPVAPELLQRIAEAAAIVEAHRLATDAALDGRILKQVALRTAKSPDQVERLAAEMRVAEEAYQYAREGWERAQSVLTNLYSECANRARAARLEVSTK